jgi:ComF family protein
MVLCAPCLADRPRHDGIAYATVYNDASRQLVLAFKHGKRIALAGQLGRLMAAKLPSVDGQEPLLVPVPLHRWRLWQRGFNQAALLAIEIQRHDKGTVLVDALVRHKATPMLGGMKRNEREHTMKGAVRVNQKREQAIKGRDVILVDDVLTSGATTNACVAALKRAGAKTVSISCFARVLDETLHGENSAYYAAQPLSSNDQNITPEAKKAPGAT